MNLKRYAPQVYSPTATEVDDLDYQYAGNCLTKVIENIPNSTGYEGGNNVIDYDLNGNMTDMYDKDIQNIRYNHLNLPVNFQFLPVSISGLPNYVNLNYLYRADGSKLRKTYSVRKEGRNQPTNNAIN